MDQKFPRLSPSGAHARPAPEEGAFSEDAGPPARYYFASPVVSERTPSGEFLLKDLERFYGAPLRDVDGEVVNAVGETVAWRVPARFSAPASFRRRR